MALYSSRSQNVTSLKNTTKICLLARQKIMSNVMKADAVVFQAMIVILSDKRVQRMKSASIAEAILLLTLLLIIVN